MANGGFLWLKNKEQIRCVNPQEVFDLGVNVFNIDPNEIIEALNLLKEYNHNSATFGINNLVCYTSNMDN
jgi:S-adenosylmethionine synthetase